MAADHLGASLSRLDRFTNRASRADDPTKNLLLSLPAAGTGRGAFSPKLHQKIWSGGVAVTISAIHRVSLATHDLAEAQKFFESYIGLGRAVKVADQTIAFGSGSRGFRKKKHPGAANPKTLGFHGA